MPIQLVIKLELFTRPSILTAHRACRIASKVPCCWILATDATGAETAERGTRSAGTARSRQKMRAALLPLLNSQLGQSGMPDSPLSHLPSKELVEQFNRLLTGACELTPMC